MCQHVQKNCLFPLILSVLHIFGCFGILHTKKTAFLDLYLFWMKNQGISNNFGSFFIVHITENFPSNFLRLVGFPPLCVGRSRPPPPLRASRTSLRGGGAGNPIFTNFSVEVKCALPPFFFARVCPVSPARRHKSGSWPSRRGCGSGCLSTRRCSARLGGEAHQSSGKLIALQHSFRHGRAPTQKDIEQMAGFGPPPPRGLTQACGGPDEVGAVTVHPGADEEGPPRQGQGPAQGPPRPQAEVGGDGCAPHPRVSFRSGGL